jgi:hypothetical protein
LRGWMGGSVSSMGGSSRRVMVVSRPLSDRLLHGIAWQIHGRRVGWRIDGDGFGGRHVARIHRRWRNGGRWRGGHGRTSWAVCTPIAPHVSSDDAAPGNGPTPPFCHAMWGCFRIQ